MPSFEFDSRDRGFLASMTLGELLKSENSAISKDSFCQRIGFVLGCAKRKLGLAPLGLHKRGVAYRLAGGGIMTMIESGKRRDLDNVACLP